MVDALAFLTCFYPPNRRVIQKFQEFIAQFIPSIILWVKGLKLEHTLSFCSQPAGSYIFNILAHRRTISLSYKRVRLFLYQGPFFFYTFLSSTGSTN
jgi:hypothetical protein